MKHRYPRNERERRFLVSRPSDRLNGRVLYWTTLHLLQLRWKFSGPLLAMDALVIVAAYELWSRLEAKIPSESCEILPLE